MRIAFFAFHLLHWRVLLPVIIELAFRNHRIVVETSRPNWLGMPTWDMRYRPRFVEGINATSLRWVADLISFRHQWNMVQRSVMYHWGQSRDNDALVSTTKDIAALADRAKADGCRAVAVGYQHLPVLVDLGGRGTGVMPDAFCPGHPFATLHRFSEVYKYGRVLPCGFPHLDSVCVSVDPADAHPWQRHVLICHPGAQRGVTGNTWLLETMRAVRQGQYVPWIATHPIPGACPELRNLENFLVDGWWPAGDDCAAILTVGSSAAYEMWSAGFEKVFFLGYAGGPRVNKFHLFQDMVIETPTQLPQAIRVGRPTSDFTREVIQAFRGIHDGTGAKRAADMIEGRL